MGVPKFYRWLSERYPKINQVITNEALLPEFDHLYLDMNGIIHGCTHPSHLDVSDVLSERDMVLGIMHYLDRIITQIVKPKVSVFMAIDGVAPRAKLNQQRSRRFRSAKDLAEATKAKKLRPLDGTDLNDADPYSGAFDSNCITPGTEFLLRISDCICYFIRKKIKEDPQWRNLSVIFSGPDVPGEGEHKIMQHIRDMRNQPGYQPNTRHCMYGQDADLIMLGLVSHEPHFTLLREIIDFSGGFSRNDNALKEVKKFTKQSDFQLLHLSILREYLQLEFVYKHDPSTYDLERIIDDFVFMTFLVGNDFLPHMPTLDIGDGAFTLLFDTYKEQRKQWGDGQYLTNAGEISDAARLEAFLKVIGAAESDIFEEREKNEVIMLKKQRQWDKRDKKPNRTPSDLELTAKEESKQNDYVSMIQSMMADINLNGTKTVDDWKPPTDLSQKDHKGRYYFEKMQLKPTDVDEHLALRQSYIEGLIWCLAYYYRGCISWGWFFPYHYGPMISDLTNLPDVFSKIKFEVGQPLKPFEQLMGCLPPASSALVPKVYRKLMCSPESPIKQFYPEDFVVDMNGKRNPWEGVNILPFIDVTLLKQMIEKHCPDNALTADERHRNRVGKVYCYTYDAAVNDTVPSCNRDIGLSNIVKCNSRVDILENHSVSNISFKPELIPGTKIPYPGFPSLNVLPIEHVELRNAGLNCFGFPSKYPNTILTMHALPEMPGAAQLAENLIGRTIFVNWPMMHEAKVVAVSDSSCEVRKPKGKSKTRKFSPPEVERWNSVSETMKEQYVAGAGYPGSGGISIGDVQIRLKVVPLQGMKTSPIDGSSKKLFGNEEADIPLQMALFSSPAPDPRFVERGPMQLKDRFPPKCRVVLTKGKYRGCIGTVLGAVDGEKVGVKVQVIPPEPPFGLAIARSVQESYISSTDAAKVLKMDPRIFGKVTGSLFFSPGKYDLGLNLKYKDKRCVLGYTRVKPDPNKNKKKDANAWSAGDTVLVVGSKRMSTNDDSDSDDNQKQRVIWEYTPKAVRLVAAYKNAFPRLFAALTKAPDEKFYDSKKVFGPKGEDVCATVLEWLKGVETATIPRMPYTTDAMPVPAVHAVQRAADVRAANLEKDGAVKESNVKVPSSAIYRERSTAATDVLLASEHSVSAPPELGDRVANLCANGVPFGARGTVVAVHDAREGCVEVVMDEEFIGGSTLQGTCANFRGKLCVWNHLLKISAADSQGIVDSVIPAGSGRAVVDKLMKDIEVADPPPEPKQPKEQKPINQQEQNATSGSGRDPKNPWNSPTRAASAPRAGSSSRGGRQGAWNQARGPPEKVVGFTKYGRQAKNGYDAWKKLVKKSDQSNGKSKGSATKNEKAQASKASSEGQLKAMLGVASASKPQPPAATENVDTNAAAAGLKAMLGLGGGTSESTTESKSAAPNESAADVLMQLMMQGSPAPTTMPEQHVPRSAFNFTYVKEGEEQPPQPEPSMMPPMQPEMMHPYPYAHMMPPMYNNANQIMAPGPQSPQAQPSNHIMSKETKSRSSTTPSSKKASSPMVPSIVVKSSKK